MGNFVSNSDANALMSEIGKKKLTVTDVMPLAASAANEGIPYLYLGATTQDFTNGSIYECQEVTPATDPKTYEWVEKYQSSVDLTYYKRIWGGTEAGWELLTDEQKAQYEYTFFEGDSDYTLSIVNAVTKGDMHPVTSNAVAEEVEDIDAEFADIVNIYGAKNILPYPYHSKSGLVHNGITYTINSDGSVTANGTANGSSTFYYFSDLKGSDIQYLNGCIFSGLSDGSDNTYFLSIHQSVSPWTPYCRLTNEGNKVISGIPNDDTLVDCIIRVANGTTVTNKTFFAMMRKPGITDDAYAPYAKTNKQLTDSTVYKTISITSATRYSDISNIVSNFRDDMPPYVKAYRSDGFYLYLYLNTILLMSSDVRFGGCNSSGPYIHGLRINPSTCDFTQYNPANATSQSLWDIGTWTITLYY